jgi:hypothetical protein
MRNGQVVKKGLLSMMKNRCGCAAFVNIRCDAKPSFGRIAFDNMKPVRSVLRKLFVVAHQVLVIEVVALYGNAQPVQAGMCIFQVDSAGEAYDPLVCFWVDTGAFIKLPCKLLNRQIRFARKKVERCIATWMDHQPAYPIDRMRLRLHFCCERKDELVGNCRHFIITVCMLQLIEYGADPGRKYGFCVEVQVGKFKSRNTSEPEQGGGLKNDIEAYKIFSLEVAVHDTGLLAGKRYGEIMFFYFGFSDLDQFRLAKKEMQADFGSGGIDFQHGFACMGKVEVNDPVTLDEIGE